MDNLNVILWSLTPVWIFLGIYLILTLLLTPLVNIGTLLIMPIFTGARGYVKWIGMGPLLNHFYIRGLHIGNPIKPRGEFKSKGTFTLRKVDFKVSLHSLLGKNKHIKLVRVMGADVIFEPRMPSSNIGKLFDNMKKEKTPEQKAKAEEEKKEKKAQDKQDKKALKEAKKREAAEKKMNQKLGIPAEPVKKDEEVVPGKTKTIKVDKINVESNRIHVYVGGKYVPVALPPVNKNNYIKTIKPAKKVTFSQRLDNIEAEISKRAAMASLGPVGDSVGKFGAGAKEFGSGLTSSFKSGLGSISK